MEKIVAGFTLLTRKAADLFKVALACMILSCIASFHDLCSFFSLILRAILFIFSLPKYCFSTRSNIVDADVDDGDGVEVSSLLECIKNQNNGDNYEDLFGEEVLHLFDESEPSFEEIKETFDMFDDDGDGYIDEKDLEKVLCRMGFSEFSQQDCRGMIRAFDENKDGRIDFEEFFKLMEDSFD